MAIYFLISLHKRLTLLYVTVLVLLSISLTNFLLPNDTLFNKDIFVTNKKKYVQITNELFCNVTIKKVFTDDTTHTYFLSVEYKNHQWFLHKKLEIYFNSNLYVFDLAKDKFMCEKEINTGDILSLIYANEIRFLIDGKENICAIPILNKKQLYSLLTYQIENEDISVFQKMLNCVHPIL